MKFTSMDIKKKIEDLKAERNEQLAIEEKAHNRAIEINRQIGKLETALKRVGEILFENGQEEKEAV